ncbi:hypothetical protein AUJ66_07145 [Candidatus Desantisbacteria bacterium CG1_02_38_46]|uniref:Peptidase A2 domain-containing protein n=1 Tax=Candidatus Desantisbacteria bacterium CG1_02_38_46 TaxID=1817893 RepID=A0A1J4SC14_9BACT|nr:MAG: hypothetical protein AUJ66_07145 [Candidatus Desantisbacteria bacterium CG1_02_38_46]
MKFPYLEVSKDNFVPIITFEICAGQRWIRLEAYIDSGATYSIFHVDTAGLLDIDYQEGKKILITVGDGGVIPVYLHKLPVRFAGLEFDAIVGFSKSLGVGFNLLGRAGFFEKFRICFNDRDKIVEATKLI